MRLLADDIECFNMNFYYFVIVPQPIVNVSLNHSGTLYAGTGLTLTCTVTLDPNVNGGEICTILWHGPRDIPGDRYIVSGDSGSGELEASGSEAHGDSLIISPLAEGIDDGEYTCDVTVSGDEYVLEAMNSGGINISVLGKIFCSLRLY